MRTRTKLHIPGAPFKMADLAKDEITGFEGIVCSHIRHLTGCDGVWLQSRTEVHDGKAVERYFDVLRVELVETNPMDIQGFPDQEASAG